MSYDRSDDDALTDHDLHQIWTYAPVGVSDRDARLLHSYCTSPEGYWSLDFCGIYELKNGEFWAFDGWTDTTGWGCQENADWYGPRASVEAAASLLTQEHRRALKFETAPVYEDIYRDYDA